MRPEIIVFLSFVGIISKLLAMSIGIMFASGQCLEDQKSLLLQLKGNITYDPLYSTGLEYWDEIKDCCNWPGVGCDRPGRVISLDLSTEYISDGINDSSTLFGLKYLQRLNLATIGLPDAPLSSMFNQLPQLTYLNLSHSGFVGSISTEFSNLSRLLTLDLSKESQGSTLELAIPDLELFLSKNLSNLRELYLDGVNMSAQGSGWSQIVASSLPNLIVLSLSNCFLSGPLHPSFIKVQHLSVVHLDNNPLSAPFPEFFSEFSNLTELTLSSCELSGTVPGKIFNLPSLRLLDLSENGELEGFFPEFQSNGSLQNLFLMGTIMSGSLPDSISNLKMLTNMNLRGSRFSGPIPGSIAKLTQLAYLDLSGNQFIGSIPSFSGSKNLAMIFLHNNKLIGEMPLLLWEGLDGVVEVDLSNNSLTGQIPSSLFSLPSIEELQLSNNNFSGKISEVPSLHSSKLKSLQLSENNLEGPIPQFFFDLKNLEYLSLSSNRLSGVIDYKNFMKLQNLTYLDLSYNNFSIITNSSDSSLAVLPQVQHLFLASCNLQELPPLRNQSTLKMLDLSNNQMTGEIPNWLWSLGDVISFRYLNLSHNQFTALQEEPSIGYLEYIDLHSNLLSGNIPLPSPNAAYLDLSNNNFSSILPPEIGNRIPRVIFFSAANNRLSGDIPLSLCNASSIQVLDLSNNTLQGTIPPCLMNNSGNLGVLNLRRNNLSGSIPEMSLQNCQTETLDISWNQIGGPVPQSLANCTNLKVLNLGYNKITDTFPCWLRNLTNLRVLSFRFNNFHGDISCLGGGYIWPSLQIIDLASNNFEGVLPSEFFKNLEAMIVGANESNTQLDHLHFQTILSGDNYYQDSTTLVLKGTSVELEKILNIFTSIDFSSNNFQGGIPETIGELKSIYLLNLSNNALSSTIPQSVGNLKQLESLDLSFNKLNGEIPNELASLTFISYLNVSYNQLIGRIPTGSQFQTFPSSSFQGNEGLCGFPLERTCDTGAKPEEEQESQESRDIGIYFSVAGGFLVGLAFFFAPILFSMRWNMYYNWNIDQLICKVLPRKYQKRYQRHSNGEI
ncbi:hypothetical protein LIER_12095 [Lithospermum erythrorhizon]|uniref:Leucine-rich repeat-containing N-terminal plant-type domain-containing protein n=1 Tax=Lithospermum erythrorhizon TaxID=34254 RepID=A0AAV3PQI1_LITER